VGSDHRWVGDRAGQCPALRAHPQSDSFALVKSIAIDRRSAIFVLLVVIDQRLLHSHGRDGGKRECACGRASTTER
jgi:hypothetical protein